MKLKTIFLTLSLSIAGYVANLNAEPVRFIDHQCLAKKYDTRNWPRGDQVINSADFVNIKLVDLRECERTADIEGAINAMSKTMSEEIKKSMSEAYIQTLLQTDVRLQANKKQIEEILSEIKRLLPDAADNLAKTINK